MSRTLVEVSDGLFNKLRENFDELQMIELAHLMSLENLPGRFNFAMGIGAAGFVGGMLCAVPVMASPEK